MRASEEVLHAELVCRLFEAAVDPRRWTGLSADIARAFGADSGTLVLHCPHSALNYLDVTANMAGQPMLDYAAYYRERDVWALQARQPGHEGAQLGADLICDSKFEHTEFYTDFCRGTGIFHALGCMVPVQGAEFGLLSIHRPRSAHAFNEDDKHRLDALLPYFQRALQLRNQLQQANLAGQCGVALLDCLDTAVFLVDEDLRLLHANVAAGALLVRGSALRLLNGRLTQQDSGSAHSLGRMVHAVLAAAPGPQSLCLERRGHPPLLLTAAPFPAPDAPPGQRPRAVVMARDPEAAVRPDPGRGGRGAGTGARRRAGQNRRRPRYQLAHGQDPLAETVPQDQYPTPGRAGGAAARRPGRHAAGGRIGARITRSSDVGPHPAA
jgi:hypothetical protein